MPTKPTIRVTLATGITLTSLVGWSARAQAPDPAAPPPAAAPAPAAPTPAELTIDNAIVKIRAMEQIAAKIVQTVDMLNQQFKIEGEYIKEKGNRIRVKLDISGLADSQATMLQVSDGKTLWDYQKIFAQPIYRKREITPIIERLKNPALDQAFRERVMANIGFGGPESLLMGFRKDARFDQIQETTVDGRTVIIVGGTWVNREGLVGPREQGLSPTAPLPPYIPSNIQITLGKDNLWPYRVQMIGAVPSVALLQEDTRQIGQDGRPIGAKRPPPKINPSRLILEYQLQPPGPIDPNKFVFAAPTDPNNTPLDDTEQFLGFLDQTIMAETERKNAAAASKEAEPILNDAIPVPRPAPGADDGLGIIPKPAAPAPR